MSLIQAIKAFFRTLKNSDDAALAAAPPPAEAFQASRQPAVQLLALMQKEGRLVDFLMEDIDAFDDADVGAAARQMHAGAKRVLMERAKIERILDAEEGARTEVPGDFDASAISLIGNVAGDGPFAGTVRHRGWRIQEIALPTVSSTSDPTVVAPAEVEVG